jgi:hypothetical protein
VASLLIIHKSSTDRHENDDVIQMVAFNYRSVKQWRTIFPVGDILDISKKRDSKNLTQLTILI